MRKSCPSLSIWALRPVLRGLPSFIHDMAGLGTPSASHFRVISPPRVTVSSFWFEELMVGRTVWSEVRKKHSGIKTITVSLWGACEFILFDIDIYQGIHFIPLIGKEMHSTCLIDLKNFFNFSVCLVIAFIKCKCEMHVNFMWSVLIQWESRFWKHEHHVCLSMCSRWNHFTHSYKDMQNIYNMILIMMLWIYFSGTDTDLSSSPRLSVSACKVREDAVP